MTTPFTCGTRQPFPAPRQRSLRSVYEKCVGLSVLVFGLASCGDEKATEVTASGEPTERNSESDSDFAEAGVSAAPGDSPTRESTSHTDITHDSGSASEGDSCTPGPGATGNPRTIVEVIQLINSLPMPVTIPCFLESLERPISLVATSSVISAQPANGQDNPRLFLLRDGISLSVVPSGDASHLLELGELTSGTQSIKGELAFPVTAPLALDAAFTHVARPAGGTVCYVCHHGEAPVTDYPVDGAFESIAYRPTPRLEINFDYVEYQYKTCDPTLEPDRCALLSALFAQGDISRGAFPEEMPTFE